MARAPPADDALQATSGATSTFFLSPVLGPAVLHPRLKVRLPSVTRQPGQRFTRLDAFRSSDLARNTGTCTRRHHPLVITPRLQSHSTPIAVSGHTRKQINSWTLPSVCKNNRLKSGSYYMMQLTLRATRQHLTALHAWCKQCLPGRFQPDVLRPGVVGMRGSMVIRLRPCMITSTPPHDLSINLTPSSIHKKIRTRCRNPPHKWHLVG